MPSVRCTSKLPGTATGRPPSMTDAPRTVAKPEFVLWCHGQNPHFLKQAAPWLAAFARVVALGRACSSVADARRDGGIQSEADLTRLPAETQVQIRDLL